MRRRIFPAAAMLAAALMIAGCGSGSAKSESAASAAASSAVSAAAESAASATEEAAAAESTTEETAAEETAAESAEAQESGAVLEDGVYSAVFTTDNSMFRVNETCDGRGTLTVENGEMTIHVTLLSKRIINLYCGLKEDAEKEGAELLEPTLDPVTYDDGYEDEVYGFDIPVPALDEEFDVALLGKKGKWYDHKVSVSDPIPLEG